MSTERTTTPRGFAIYAEFTDSHNHSIRVQESSSVYGGIWIFTSDKDGNCEPPHLSIDNAKTLIQALQEAIEHQEKSTRIWRK